MRKISIPLSGLLFFTSIALSGDDSTQTGNVDVERPNIVLIFLDDAGFADFRPFGKTAYPTPHVQKLAEQGRSFSSFHVPQAICSASRAALMTGCYPGRTKVFSALFPGEKGLDPGFPTMGEVFQEAGYKTAVFGKWHIGDQPETRPHARGFDESAGLMYSNDMWEYHPTNPEMWGKAPLQYWSNGKVMVDRVTPEFQKSLTERSANRSVDFIHRHKDSPFFLYVPFVMPHVPLYCSDAFEGKSGAGLYGDVIMELDYSIGRIMDALKEHDLEKKTIVLFASDNGPWSGFGNHAGVTPFREAKATSFNGGVISPFIIRYPGKLEAGSRSDVLFGSIDLLPTLCHLAGVPLPENPIDGRNVWPVISGEQGASHPHTYYAISNFDKLECVYSADGRWKLHLPHPYRRVAKAGLDGAPGEYETEQAEMALYDLKADPQEMRNVMTDFPEVTEKLLKLAMQHNALFYE